MPRSDDLVSVPRWALDVLSSAGLAQVAVVTVMQSRPGPPQPVATVRLDGAAPQPLFVDAAMLDELKEAVRLAKRQLRQP